MYIVIGKSNRSYCSDLRAELNKKKNIIHIFRPNLHSLRHIKSLC